MKIRHAKLTAATASSNDNPRSTCEMYYRYQQSLIDEAINTPGALLRRAAGKP
jgi:hypothetical protein